MQMATSAVGPQGTAAANGVVLPEQWTASKATIAATLAALKGSMAVPPASTVPEAGVVPPASVDVELPPSDREAAQAPAPARRADLPPLPTRRSLREAGQGTRQAQGRHSRAGLFTRLLTVRAFRTRHSQARAVGAPAAAVGEILAAAGIHGVLTLHQRRVPGQRGRIEFLAISASGVHVVDVKHFKNQAVELVEADGPGHRVDLVVGGRVMTAAAAATARRVAGIRAVLEEAGLEHVPVSGTLCFVDGLLPLGASDLVVRGVHVVRPNGLTTLVTRGGSLATEHVLTLRDYLAEHLPECG